MAYTLQDHPDVVYEASEGERFAGESTLQVVTCATCHVTYAIPRSFYRSAKKYPGDRSNGWKICCPFGHTWWYVGQTEEERLKNQLTYARDDAARARAQRDQAQAEARAQKAAKTRFKNDRDRLKTRAAHGVCPCCQRTFKQLARHMAAKHPSYVEASD